MISLKTIQILLGKNIWHNIGTLNEIFYIAILEISRQLLFFIYQENLIELHCKYTH